MKRKLITEMRNEWRSNIWMVIELALVGLVLWGVTCVLYSLFDVTNTSHLYDTDDLVVADLGTVPDSANQYIPYADENQGYGTDMLMLRRRMEANPLVEVAGTGNNAVLYRLNFWDNSIWRRDGDSTYTYGFNYREVTPSMARVYRIRGTRGETPEQVMSQLEQDKSLISTADLYQKYSPELFAGRNAYSSFDSTKVYTIGSIVVEGMRQNDYEPVMQGMMLKPLADDKMADEMVLRVKPGAGREFVNSLKPSDMRQGNVYIQSIHTLDELAESAHKDKTLLIMQLSVCGGFMLVVVFLGFLGTFWFRTQQRSQEIAIRRVNGATQRNVFARLVSEGMILLMVGSAIWIAAAFVLLRNETVREMLDSLRSMNEAIPYISMVIVVAVLALTIVAGVWMPARKAMRTNVSETIKDQ